MAPDKISLFYISLYNHSCSILADNTKALQVIENVKLIFSCPSEVVRCFATLHSAKYILPFYIVQSTTSLLFLQTSVLPRVGDVWKDNIQKVKEWST